MFAALLLGVSAWFYLDVRRSLPRAADVSHRPGTNVTTAMLPNTEEGSVPAQAPPGSARMVAPDEVEICGHGVVKRPGDGIDPMDRVPLIERVRARVEAQAALRTHPDPRVQAVRLSMLPDAEGLAQLALADRDPLVYALARGVCALPRGDIQQGELSAPAGCGQLSAQGQAEREPDNAAAWLAVAAEAEARGDAAGVAEALHRASVAPTLDSHWGRTTGIVLNALPQDLPPLARMLTLVDAIGTEAARTPFGGTRTLSRYCSAAEMQDANRHQTCEALARLLIERSGNMLERMIGIRIAERVGWSEERTLRLRDEMQAWAKASQSTYVPDDDADAYSCKQMKRLEDHMLLTARLGEVGAMREAARQSGASMSALIAEAAREREAFTNAKAASAAGE